MRITLITLIWLLAINQTFAAAKATIKDHYVRSIADYSRDIKARDPSEEKIDHGRLLKEWQDWILANPIIVNYLNTLMVHTSRQDFALIVPSSYSVKYVQSIGSFHATVSHLAAQIRVAFGDARKDLNRVHAGMENVPRELKSMVVFIKHAPFELLMMSFPDSFNDIERLVNDSLGALNKPEKVFQQVLNLLTEIDYLLNNTNNSILAWQVHDIRIQWTYLTELIIELGKRAQVTINSFLLQFNWILAEFIRPDMVLSDSNRNFMLSLLLPKIVEIDQTSDVLGCITKAYTEISSLYSDEEMNGYGHLLQLPTEEQRKLYLKKFQRDLVPQVIQNARLALHYHTQYLRRDRNRRKDYEKFLSETSPTDLINVLG
ncbi:unnamed protein product [Adineta ricciae]|uniref:Uncharacterized protein n=1 Tax=Adineta ricciae TaxID=249248 RepID=A0A816AA97_ADIRI|nr:unnamed protein product [Adineta ricciae]CAF1595444.1 unnamed protein product [Adineta ricciae]